MTTPSRQPPYNDSKKQQNIKKSSCWSLAGIICFVKKSGLCCAPRTFKMRWHLDATGGGSAAHLMRCTSPLRVSSNAHVSSTQRWLVT